MDLKDLSLDELQDLNRNVIDEIRYRQRLRSCAAKSQFRVGDRVTVSSDRNSKWAGITGTVTKIMPKNVMIDCNDPFTGRKVNLKAAPTLLSKVA